MLSAGKKQLTKELLDLWENAPEDIKLLCNEIDITDVQAIITGPSGTPYAGGHFHVKLALSNDYPQSPPRGFFLTKVFHPNVASPSGEICVNTLKKDWKSDLGIRHILLTIKCLLIAPNPESALNEEAGRMLMEDYESYAQRARMFTEVHAKPHVDAGDAAAAVSLDKSKTTTARKGGGNRSKSTTNNSTAKKMLKRL